METLAIDAGQLNSRQVPRLPAMVRRLMRNNPCFRLHNTGSDRRPELQDYIRRTFAKAYDADVQVFAPLLLELRCAGSVSGVAGIRPAANTSLYVEHYLDEPAERAIRKTMGEAVSREQILEICNLAALAPGACQLINITLAAAVLAGGYRYAILAGTAQLRKILTKQNFVVRTLTSADPSRLGAGAGQWGRYYDTCPEVLIVDVRATVTALREQLLASALLDFLAADTRALGQELHAYRYGAGQSHAA